MAADDMYTEALLNYLQSDEWRGYIEVFVETNCTKFSDLSEFNHEHHDLWRHFQEIVESILDNALQQLGGSIETLEKALDERASGPARGPRDALQKELLRQLLSFDDFKSFCQMMKDAADERTQDGGAGESAGYGDAGGYEEGTGYEEGGYQDGDFQEGGYQEGDYHEGAYQEGGNQQDDYPKGDYQRGDYQQGGYQDGAYQDGAYQEEAYDENANYYDNSAQSAPAPGFEQLAADGSNAAATAAGDGYDPNWTPLISPDELVMRFVTAQSIVECYEHGTLGSQEEEYVSWAYSMNDMYSVVADWTDEAQLRTVDAETWEYLQTLQQEYERIEAEIAQFQREKQKRVDERAQLRTMETLEDDQTAGEKSLEALFARSETVRESLVTQRRECTSYTKPPANVPSKTLEELYLFFKEKVHNNENLEEHKETIHSFVFSRIDTAQSNLIPVLIELMLLEEESMLLQKEIQESLSGAGDDEAKEEGALQDSKGLDNDNVAEGKRDGEGDESKYDAAAGAKEAGPQSEPKPAPAATSSILSEPLPVLSPDRGGAVPDQQLGTGLERLPEPPAALVEPTTEQREELPQALVELKKKHEKELASVRVALQTQRERQQESLAARLAAKRKARLTEVRKRAELAGDEEDIDLDEALEAEEARLEEEADKERVAQRNSMDDLDAAVVAGIKKRCIQEMRIARRRENGEEVTEEDAKQAMDDMVAKLRRKHEHDQQELVSALQSERARQQAKLLKRMAAVRRKKLVKMRAAKAEAEGISKDALDDEDGSEGVQLDDSELAAVNKETFDKFVKDMRKLQTTFDQQEAQALRRPQAKYFALLTALTSSQKQHEHDDAFGGVATGTDDGENQLDDQWVRGLEQLTAAYENSASELESRLMKERQRQRRALEKRVRKRRQARVADMRAEGASGEDINKFESELRAEFVDDLGHFESAQNVGHAQLFQVIAGAFGDDVQSGAADPSRLRALVEKEGDEDEDEDAELSGSTGAGAAAAGTTANSVLREAATQAILDEYARAQDERERTMDHLREKQQKQLSTRMKGRRERRLRHLREQGATESEVQAEEKALDEEEAECQEKLRQELAGAGNALEKATQQATADEDEDGATGLAAAEAARRGRGDRAGLRNDDDEDDDVDMVSETVVSASVNRAGGKTVSLGKTDPDMLGMEEEDAEQQLTAEVARIAQRYDEESQKLDLVMQMKQARQRHALQQRLMKRRNRKASV